jgi:hypothetical protein
LNWGLFIQEGKMDKAQLTGELAKAEMEARQAERKLASSKGAATGGAVGVLIGIVLLFFIWPLGALLLVAGILAWVTGAIQRSQAQSALAAAEKRIVELRAQIAMA